jgi:hypothetical protein
VLRESTPGDVSVAEVRKKRSENAGNDLAGNWVGSQRWRASANQVVAMDKQVKSADINDKGDRTDQTKGD